MLTGNRQALPVGVGLIAFVAGIEAWIDVLAEYWPAMVWLSCGTSDEFRMCAEAVRTASPHQKIWVRVGIVAVSVEAAIGCVPDALVLQGADAGSHGHKPSASVISLIPEVSDALCERKMNAIALIGASGIMKREVSQLLMR